MLEVNAFLDKDCSHIFRGTMAYVPRIGEEVVVWGRSYTVKNVVCYLDCDGENMIPDIQLVLGDNEGD